MENILPYQMVGWDKFFINELVNDIWDMKAMENEKNVCRAVDDGVGQNVGKKVHELVEEEDTVNIF